MFRKIDYKINDRYNNVQIQSFLREYGKYSTRLIKELKRIENGILLNNQHARAVDYLKAGDVLTVNILLGECSAEKMDIPISVAYEDEDILVVDKPPFMAVHQSLNHFTDSLANGVAFYLDKKGINTSFRAVNRLDRDTSGLVVIGLNPYSASRLSKNVDKTYFAVIDGVLEGQGTINAPIRRVNESMIKREVGDGGETAITHWQSVKIINNRTLLKIKLETGRTHQIRVHFSSINLALIGDSLYGKESDLISRQALHCGEVSFIHPITNEKIVVISELPIDIQKLFNKGQSPVIQRFSGGLYH